MADSMRTTRFRFWLWLVRVIGVIVPRRLRVNWRQEWEAELRYREALLAEWDRLDWKNKLDLLRRSSSAFWDAVWLQPKRWEDEMIQDLRYGVRTLLKHKGFTAVAALTLALGIGINTSVFSLVNAALLRPLTAVEPDQLVRVYDGRAISYPAYADYRDQCAAFAGLAAYAPRKMGLLRGDQSEPLDAEVVTENYFDVLGARAAVGRAFRVEEGQASSAQPVVVISYGLWRRLFNASSDAVGQPLALNGEVFTVIGVAPKEFSSANTGFEPDIWVTVRQYTQLSNRNLADNRDDRWLSMIGRLKPGVGLAQGEAAAKLTARNIAQAHPGASNKGDSRDVSVTLIPAKGLAISPGDQVTVMSAAGLLTAVVGLILIVACANVTNMLLARAMTRRKEIAVRLALGATRKRLIRQLLTESVMLAVLGGALGLLFAVWTPDLLLSLIPPDYHGPALDTSLDSRVFGFTFGLSLLTSALCGLVPALQASKPDLTAALKDETPIPGRRRARVSLRSSLVVAQVAISLVLLIVAGLFVRNFRRALVAEPGFAADEVLAAPLDLKLSGYDLNRSKAFYDDLLPRVGALPQARAVSLAKFAPLTGNGNRRWLSVEGYYSRPGEEMIIDSNVVGPGYFQTMGIPVIRGRDFNAQDTENSPGVVIINEALARKYWPMQDAVGKRVRMQEGAPYLEVVGVVKNSKYMRPEESSVPFIYEPLTQASETDLTLLVRVTTNPLREISVVEKTVRSLDKSLPVFPRVLSEQLFVATAPARMSALISGVFGLLALSLTIVGIYGLMSYIVSQRTHEIGVRLALGAQRSDVLKLIVSNGMRLVLIGAGIGLVAASFLTRVLSAFLFGVSATDAVTFSVVAITLIVVGLLACYLPARRATKVDPMIALRRD